MSDKLRERKKILSKLDENRELNLDGKCTTTHDTYRARRVAFIYERWFNKTEENVESITWCIFLLLECLYCSSMYLDCIIHLWVYGRRMGHGSKCCSCIDLWALQLLNGNSISLYFYCCRVFDSLCLSSFLSLGFIRSVPMDAYSLLFLTSYSFPLWSDLVHSSFVEMERDYNWHTTSAISCNNSSISCPLHWFW